MIVYFLEFSGDRPSLKKSTSPLACQRASFYRVCLPKKRKGRDLKAPPHFPLTDVFGQVGRHRRCRFLDINLLNPILSHSARTVTSAVSEYATVLGTLCWENSIDYSVWMRLTG